MMSDVHDDLEAWRAGLHPDWEYDTVAALGADSGCYNGLCHIYPNLWVAEAWNNWRGLRLLVVQTLMETCIDPNEMAGLQDIVRQMSTDICVSVSSFTERPRKSFLPFMTATDHTRFFQK